MTALLNFLQTGSQSTEQHGEYLSFHWSPILPTDKQTIVPFTALFISLYKNLIAYITFKVI